MASIVFVVEKGQARYIVKARLFLNLKESKQYCGPNGQGRQNEVGEEYR